MQGGPAAIQLSRDCQPRRFIHTVKVPKHTRAVALLCAELLERVKLPIPPKLRAAKIQPKTNFIFQSFKSSWLSCRVTGKTVCPGPTIAMPEATIVALQTVTNVSST